MDLLVRCCYNRDLEVIHHVLAIMLTARLSIVSTWPLKDSWRAF